ncbi:MAG: DUF6492 family protein [Lachnospiraceae bacterium]|nr:DUF6492 family protein [Lachnospiraceae bacterium]
MNDFDTLVVVIPDDFLRLKRHYIRLSANLPGQLFFVGPKELGALVSGLVSEADDSSTSSRIRWIDENSLLSFDAVYSYLADRMTDMLKGRELPRKVAGWYYQQFLKMNYALTCSDKYYMVWDGDTVPCKKVEMFKAENGKPYFDLKNECHELYFETLGKLFPGMGKVIRQSFISEHMLFDAAIMRELIKDIEENDSLPGSLFWEKILSAIPADKIQESAFSEFETYGTFTALRYMNAYALRKWHSFRLAGEFFDPDTICERDFEWLSKDFDAISFEKGHFVREDHKNLFDNPAYQEKLSARQMLESIQDLFNGGYVESWS